MSIDRLEEDVARAYRFLLRYKCKTKEELAKMSDLDILEEYGNQLM